MRFSKTTWITGFALFSLFFGAGNLIFPPFLGYNAGDGWSWVTIGFLISAVVIPILAIQAHARLQGTMMDFGRKVSPGFALVYSLIVYVISIALPAPRTASVTYEMAIEPYFNFPSWGLSTIYFGLVLIVVLNRSKIVDIIGKFLTPAILLILGAIILIGLFGPDVGYTASSYSNNFTSGLREGYQTFDAIGGVLVGGVLVISCGFKTKSDTERRRMIAQAGLMAGIGFFIIYTGMIALGAANSGVLDIENRTDLLGQLSLNTLGDFGRKALGALVALACFTTAVGIITGTADFFKGLFKQSQRAYIITAVISCILGIIIGRFDVHYIVEIAIPALMFIYPITIVLILLNVLPGRFASAKVFKVVVAITILFSLPDFLATIGFGESVTPIQEFLPLGTITLGWLIPALLGFLGTNILFSKRKA